MTRFGSGSPLSVRFGSVQRFRTEPEHHYSDSLIPYPTIPSTCCYTTYEVALLAMHGFDVGALPTWGIAAQPALVPNCNLQTLNKQLMTTMRSHYPQALLALSNTTATKLQTLLRLPARSANLTSLSLPQQIPTGLNSPMPCTVVLQLSVHTSPFASFAYVFGPQTLFMLRTCLSLSHRLCRRV